MRHLLCGVLICFIIHSCKKDKTPPIVQPVYSSEEDNFLILKIGDTLEGVYKYYLPITTLSNDSLPLIYESCFDMMNSCSNLKFKPNPNSLINTSSNNVTFSTNEIAPSDLVLLQNPQIIDSNSFQLIGNQLNVSYSSIWLKVSNFEVVKEYRDANPNSKIGIQKIIINEYYEELGLSAPTEKFLVFLVK